METVNVVLNGFTADTVDMANVVGAAVTVTQAQLGGAAAVTVNNLSTTSSLTLGSTFTGTLTMTGQGTVNAVDAARVDATLGADCWLSINNRRRQHQHRKLGRCQLQLQVLPQTKLQSAWLERLRWTPKYR